MLLPHTKNQEDWGSIVTWTISIDINYSKYISFDVTVVPDKEDFKNFVNVLLLFRYYLPFKMGGSLHF